MPQRLAAPGLARRSARAQPVRAETPIRDAVEAARPTVELPTISRLGAGRVAASGIVQPSALGAAYDESLAKAWLERAVAGVGQDPERVEGRGEEHRADAARTTSIISSCDWPRSRDRCSSRSVTEVASSATCSARSIAATPAWPSPATRWSVAIWAAGPPDRSPGAVRCARAAVARTQPPGRGQGGQLAAAQICARLDRAVQLDPGCIHVRPLLQFQFSDRGDGARACEEPDQVPHRWEWM